MSTQSSTIVQRVWNYCNVLRGKATWSEENPEGRWHSFTYDELMARDKVNLDIFWLQDDSLEDSANLPSPVALALEIVEDLKAALVQFEAIEEALSDEE
jgi:type I restriction enzyme M protein